VTFAVRTSPLVSFEHGTLLFGPRLGTLCDRLLAVKHLGNAGSHPEDVTEDDARDGFDILEDALAAVYGDGNTLDWKVKEINRRRGPRFLSGPAPAARRLRPRGGNAAAEGHGLHFVGRGKTGLGPPAQAGTGFRRQRPLARFLWLYNGRPEVFMPVDPKVWVREFRRDGAPAWPCPRCRFNTLIIVENTFHEQPNYSSQANMPDEYYVTEYDEGVFCCLLRCGRGDCKEGCAVTGRYRKADVEFPDGGMGTVTFCQPTMIDPPPPVIRLPADCPGPVEQETARAFALFWVDPAACLNSVRQAVELFLTDIGIPKSHKVAKKSGGRRLVRWNLHDRIELLRNSRSSIGKLCDRLLAVKHLGNAGSHPGDVAPRDALDGFDILEDVLEAVYGDGDRVGKAVKEINRRRGPRRR
jgi:hypothetical protein